MLSRIHAAAPFLNGLVCIPSMGLACGMLHGRAAIICCLGCKHRGCTCCCKSLTVYIRQDLAATF